MMDKGTSVKRVGDGLANAYVLEDRIAQIEGQVGVNGSGRAGYGKSTIQLYRRNHVGRKSINGKISRALAQLQRPGGGIGHHGKAYPLELGRAAPVLGIALDHDFLIG